MRRALVREKREPTPHAAVREPEHSGRLPLLLRRGVASANPRYARGEGTVNAATLRPVYGARAPTGFRPTPE